MKTETGDCIVRAFSVHRAWNWTMFSVRRSHAQQPTFRVDGQTRQLADWPSPADPFTLQQRVGRQSWRIICFSGDHSWWLKSRLSSFIISWRTNLWLLFVCDRSFPERLHKGHSWRGLLIYSFVFILPQLKQKSTNKQTMFCAIKQVFMALKKCQCTHNTGVIEQL